MNRIGKLRILLSLLLVFSLFLLPGCRPEEVVPTPEPGPKAARETAVYVAGWGDTDDESFAGYWQDGQWKDLSACSDPGKRPWRYAFAISVSGDDVYVAGYNGCDSKLVACYWKNGVRTDLAHPAADSYASSMCVSGDDVYIAGWLDFDAYTIPCYWKNGVRTELNRLGPSRVDRAEAIDVSGNDVYVAGTVNRNPDASQMISSPCYWKNGERVDLKAYDASNLGFGNSICVARGKVYVAGYIMYGCDTMPCYWIDGVRYDLKNDVPGWAYSIQVSGTDVHIAGMVQTGQGENYKTTPCVWKNKARTDLDMAESGFAASIFVLDKNVFVAGFGNIGSYYHTPCYWKNGVRTDLKPGRYPGGCTHAVFATYK
jgi:hypothetical protein